MSRTHPALRAEALEDRLAPASAGTIDPTFGTNGAATLPDLGPTIFTTAAVATGSDGSVVLVGTTHSPTNTQSTTNTDFDVFRFTPSGQLDASFGTGGQVIVPFDLSGPGQTFQGANADLATGVVVRPDGRIVVTGWAQTTATESVFAAAGLTTTGQLDSSFGTGGRAILGFGTNQVASAQAATLQPDGSVVIAGGVSTPSAGTFILPPGDMAVVRLTAAGQPDPSFGSGTGEVRVSFPTNGLDIAGATRVAVGPDGSVVLAGTTATSVQQSSLNPRVYNYTFADVLVKLTAGGQLDASFGTGGRLMLPFNGQTGILEPSALRVLADGRIMVASPESPGQAVIARLTPSGLPDTSYDGDGMANPPDTFAPNLLGVNATILPDGRGLFVTADFSGTPGTTSGSRVLGLTVDGAIDPAFGPNPPLIPGVSLLSTFAAPNAPLPDGNAIFIGQAFNGVVPGREAAFRVFTQVGPMPVAPGSVLVGGTADGTARVLSPTGAGFAVSTPVTFFPGIPLGVRTATADVNGDGTPDLIGGAGPGGLPTIFVLDGKTGALLTSPLAFEPSFTGGVFVAAGDLDGDGRAEIVATPDQGGGPNVVILSLNPDGTITTRASFFALGNPAFRGGARPAVGDLNGDGTPDVAIGAGFLGGPNVEVHDGKALAAGDFSKLIGSGFFAFDGSDAQTLRNGVFLAIGDLNGDGFADLIAGGGPGGGPRVLALDGKMLSAGDVAGAYAAPVANFFFGDGGSRGGVRVATTKAAGESNADLVVGSGEGLPSQVRVYRGKDFTPAGEPATFQDLDPFGQALPGGVFVG
jgi:uncharacterized delta-60 repeat protein